MKALLTKKTKHGTQRKVDMLWQTDLRWLPIVPTFWCLTLFNSLLLSIGRAYNLLLFDKRWAIAPMVRLYSLRACLNSLKLEMLLWV